MSSFYKRITFLCGERTRHVQAVLFQIGTHNDGLSDVFCLLLSENLHRSVTLDSNAGGLDGFKILNSYGDLLINYRIRLNDLLIDELGELSDWSTVSGQLMAIAYLKHLKVEELLNTYLEARQVIELRFEWIGGRFSNMYFRISVQ